MNFLYKALLFGSLLLGTVQAAGCALPNVAGLPPFAQNPGGGQPITIRDAWKETSDGYGANWYASSGNDDTASEYIYMTDENPRGTSVTLTNQNSTTPISALRFLKIGLNFANNYGSLGSSGDQTIVTLYYGSTPVMIFKTSPNSNPLRSGSLDANGFVYPINGAKLYDSDGNLANQTDWTGSNTGALLPSSAGGVPTSAVNTGIKGIQITGEVRYPTLSGRYRIDSLLTAGNRATTYGDMTYVLLELPDSLLSQAQSLMFKATGALMDSGGNTALGYYDDVMVSLPQTIFTYLCLQKTQPDGTPGTFNYTLNNAEPESSSLITTNNSDTVSEETAHVVYQPNVTVTETGAGNFGMSQVSCVNSSVQGFSLPVSVPALSMGTPEAGAPGATSFTVRPPAGGMTTCTVSNSYQAPPTVTLVKKLPQGLYTADDQFTLSASTAKNGAFSTVTSGTQPTYSAGQTFKPTVTYAVSSTRGDTSTATRNGNFSSIAVSEAVSTGNPKNYVSSYQCTAPKKSGSSAPTAATSGNNFTLALAYDDAVTCTFTNAVASPVVTVSKSGPAYSQVSTPAAAGQLDNTVTIPYTITVTNKLAQPLNNVVITDEVRKVTAGGVPSAGVISSASDGGVIAGNTVIWGKVNLPANGSATFTVNVTAPSAADFNRGSGVNSVSDTVTVTAPSPYAHTASASATTALSHVSLTKTIDGKASETVKPNQVVKFCVTATNYSPFQVNGVTIVEPSLEPSLNWHISPPTGNNYSVTVMAPDGNFTETLPPPLRVNIGSLGAAGSGKNSGSMCFNAKLY